MKLRVMTHNVLDAFHERDGETLLFREERADAVRSVVRACAPDVVGITEAAYFGVGGRVLRPAYAELFGMPHVHAAGFEGDFVVRDVSP